MSLSKVRRLHAAVAICHYFPVSRCRLIIYTLLILKILHLFFRLKKIWPSSKIGPVMAGPTGPVPPGLISYYLIISSSMAVKIPGRTETCALTSHFIPAMYFLIYYHTCTLWQKLQNLNINIGGVLKAKISVSKIPNCYQDIVNATLHRK